MRLRKHPFLLIAAALAACALLVSCSDDDDNGGTRPPQTIPEEVLELADDFFSLIGSVIEGDPPPFSGLTILPEEIPEEFTDGFVLSIIFDDMDPEPPSGPLVNGTITLTCRLVQTTKQILIGGEIVISDRDTDVTLYDVEIDGIATWLTGGPDTGEPDYITGTFTVNGTEYDLLRIFQLLSEQGDDRPINPVPPMYRGAQLHLLQYRVDGEETWTPSDRVRFYISEDGCYYMMQEGENWGTPEEAIDVECEGTIDWHWDDEDSAQKLHFYDDAGEQDRLFWLYTFDPTHLSGSVLWGDAGRFDMWFTVVTY